MNQASYAFLKDSIDYLQALTVFQTCYVNLLYTTFRLSLYIESFSDLIYKSLRRLPTYISPFVLYGLSSEHDFRPYTNLLHMHSKKIFNHVTLEV